MWDLGLDLRHVRFDFSLESEFACLDSGLEGKEWRLTCELERNYLVPPLPYIQDFENEKNKCVLNWFKVISVQGKKVPLFQ